MQTELLAQVCWSKWCQCLATFDGEVETACACQSDSLSQSIPQIPQRQETHARASRFYRQQSPSLQLCFHTV